jgi:hypothetical protein
MGILQKQWLDYRTSCYPKRIPALQEAELYRAFFAGAFTALTATMAASNDSEASYAAIAAIIDEAKATCYAIVNQTGS